MAIVVAAVVLLATVVGVAALIANRDSWKSPLRDAVASIPELQAGDQKAAGSGSESLLLLVTDAEDRVAAIALVGVADEGPATLTVIPARLFELLPGYGEFPLSEAVAFEGPDLAALAVANTLGVRVDRAVAVTAAQLAAALPSGVDVELSEPVLVDQDGDLVQLTPAGAGRFGDAVLGRLLTDPGRASQISWLERQAAVWQGVLDELAADGAAAGRLLGEGQAAGTLARAGDGRVELVPVTPVAVAGDDDGFQLFQADAAAFVSDRLGHLALAANGRPRVEVLNGNGEIQATRSVVAALVAAGLHVVNTDNADNFDFVETVVISQGNANLPSAEAAAAVLGVRSVRLELAAPSGVVDLSIIVGHDIATLRS